MLKFPLLNYEGKIKIFGADMVFNVTVGLLGLFSVFILENE